MSDASARTVNVDLTRKGAWEVELPDRQNPIACETLDDAKRVAYLCAAHRHPCELVVRDAYHRVLHREVIAGDSAAARATTPGRELLTIRRQQHFPARRRGGRR